MKVLIITGDRLNNASKPERARWRSAIEEVIDQTFADGRLVAGVVVGSNDGIDEIALDVAMKVPMFAVRVAGEGGLIFSAKLLKDAGANVSFAVFHDNLFFSKSTRQVLDLAQLHSFPAIVVSSHGHVQVKAA